MRKSGILSCLTAIGILASAGTLRGGPPVVETGILIQDGTGDLKVVSYAVPEVVDWNNDGRKDLLIGENQKSAGGFIRLYLNQGTDASPVFDGSTVLTTESGAVIKTEGG